MSLIHGVRYTKGKYIVNNYNDRSEVPIHEEVVTPEELLDYLEEVTKKRV